jgi:hypothetical protein
MDQEIARQLGIAAGKAAALSVELPSPHGLIARSLYNHLSQALRKIIPPEAIPSFMDGVARGIVEARADIPRILPALERLPGEPRFQPTYTFTREEVKEGRVFRSKEGAGYRALNDAAQQLIIALIRCFREKASRTETKEV